MKILLLIILFFAMTQNASTAPISPSYCVSDITLYGLRKRFQVFNGEPGTIQHVTSGETLVLTKSSKIGPGFHVLDSLRVNGQAMRSIAPLPLEYFFTLTRGPDGLRLSNRSALQGVYYFNGVRWFTLSGPLLGDQTIRVSPIPRPGLYGAGTLTHLESQAITNYLRIEKQQLVIGVMSSSPSRGPYGSFFTPRPVSYRINELAVQVGIKTLSNKNLETPLTSIISRRPQADLSAPEEISRGFQSLYQDDKPSVRLDETRAAFDRTWRLLRGIQTPMPTTSCLDFQSSKVATVFLGRKLGIRGGYDLRIISAIRQGNRLDLQFKIPEATPDTIQAQNMTSPYVMIQVTKQVTAITVTLVPARR
jgi:PrcB C-terminal